MKKIRSLFNLTSEQLKIGRYFARLRKETLQKMKSELKERKKYNPKATPEELSMGAYIEAIEPQARDTVLKLREKGYETIGSGFWDYWQQSIYLEKKQFENFKFSDKLSQRLVKEGAIIKCEPNTVSFEITKTLSLDEIKKIWQEIEKELPNLGHPAKPAHIQAAGGFRKRQAELNK